MSSTGPASVGTALIQGSCFALAALVMTWAVDLTLWDTYPGMHLKDGHPDTATLAHGTALLGVLVLGKVGSTLVFLTYHDRMPTKKACAVSGALFGLVGPVAAVFGFTAAGLLGAAAALALTAGSMAYVACRLAKPEDPRPEV